MSPRRAFSLVEMLCTLAIAAILLVLVTGRGASKDKISRSNCRNNLQKIYLALSLYNSDNRGAYPALASAQTSEPVLSLLVPRSTTMTEIFICPASKDKELPEAESFATRQISYAYYMGRATNDPSDPPLVTDRQANPNAKTQGQDLFAPKGNHGKNGGNLLLLSGSIPFSGPKAERDLPLPPPVVLLNPR